ncbi:MAG TPA: ornithine cyclodeaminase family protein [Ktedonobacterales bacterium]|nr:ornithine cyclodeaminase family protein [Ktedonobacterales bacterium]
MTLILREADVRAVLTMSETMRVLDAAFRRQAVGEARNQPRRRVVLPEGRGVLHVLPAYVPGTPGHPEADGPGLMGLKSYSAVAGSVRFFIQLFSAEDGRLLALIEADLLGQMRTGGASGVATRYMARPDARVVGLIGAGGQAQAQALAMCAARPVEKFLVYARSIERARAFCEALVAETGVACSPVEKTEQAVREADIVVTATTAHDSVALGAWLQPGQHLNVMGSNWAHRREVDSEAVRRSDVVAVDARDQAEIEAGDLLLAERSGDFAMERAVELSQIVAGIVAGRPRAEAITLFKSLGIGLEDVAVAGWVYAQARERGLGQEIELLP